MWGYYISPPQERVYSGDCVVIDSHWSNRVAVALDVDVPLKVAHKRIFVLEVLDHYEHSALRNIDKRMLTYNCLVAVPYRS